MSCKIFTFPSFEKEAKRLNKRYKSFKFDLKELMNELSSSPSLGADLGGACVRFVWLLNRKELVKVAVPVL